MHELGIIMSVLDTVRKSADQAGATKLISVKLRVGEMTEAIEDALQFAFEALTEDDPFMDQATLDVEVVKPKSQCLECGHVFTHDRYQRFCPACESFATALLEGRELTIDSIEVDIPDGD